MVLSGSRKGLTKNMSENKLQIETEHSEAHVFAIDHEKHPELDLPEDVIKSDAPVYGDWTPKEEASALRKADFIIMPLVVLGFFMMQLDRGNIANALTDTLLQDLHITTNDVNVRYQLLSLGILLFEIPSNIILQRIGARVWITGQILLWGLVAALQMFVTGRTSFLVTGFLIGCLEAGFIPGSLYYLSTWYKTEEYAVRNTAFYLGNLGASALSGVIASGILSLSGQSGLAGWQWLFMLEGVMTVGIGIVWLFFLPETPSNCSPLLFPKWKMFNERQIHILATRVIVDDAQKSAGARVHITFRDVVHVFGNWRIWQHVLLSFIGMMPGQALALYFPLIIKSLGFPTLKANALSSIGNFCAVVVVMTLAFVSDKTRRRGITTLIPLGLLVIFEGSLYGLPPTAGKWAHFALVCLVQSQLSIWHTLNVTWLSTNCVTVRDRAIGLPMVVMAANAAGMIGPQIMQASDAPRYRNGFIAGLTLTTFNWFFGVGISIGYFWRNRKRRAQGRLNEDHSAAEWVAEVEGEIEEKEVRRRFVYTW